MHALLRRFRICYQGIDAQFRVVPDYGPFWSYLGQPLPAAPVLLCDLFPELVGMEELVRDSLSAPGGEFRLPAVKRGESYFNLILFSAQGAPGDELPPLPPGIRGLAVIEDATAELNTQQSLTQRRNEVTLLTRELESRNAELLAANLRLDSLMQLIRTQNHELDRKVKLRTEELRQSRLSVIATLARVAEFRDTDTGGHIYRIGRSSVLIGRRHGLGTAELEHLFYASLLHDVGKIGIPDSILLKPAGLDSGEWTVMRQHTSIGAEILERRDHDVFRAARDVALSHHEKWDGRGYPQGLAGEDIPVIARICSVADVFDALTSKRPYKEAWSSERALAAVRAEAGSAFDPSVVESFLAVADDILALRSEAGSDLESLSPELD